MIRNTVGGILERLFKKKAPKRKPPSKGQQPPPRREEAPRPKPRINLNPVNCPNNKDEKELEIGVLQSDIRYDFWGAWNEYKVVQLYFIKSNGLSEPITVNGKCVIRFKGNPFAVPRDPIEKYCYLWDCRVPFEVGNVFLNINLPQENRSLKLMYIRNSQNSNGKLLFPSPDFSTQTVRNIKRKDDYRSYSYDRPMNARLDVDRRLRASRPFDRPMNPALDVDRRLRADKQKYVYKQDYRYFGKPPAGGYGGSAFATPTKTKKSKR